LVRDKAFANASDLGSNAHLVLYMHEPQTAAQPKYNTQSICMNNLDPSLNYRVSQFTCDLLADFSNYRATTAASNGVLL
jgi:hypothetical protein